LTRLVNDEDAPLDLDGTTARLFVQQVVVVQDGRCKTESYVYRLQADASPKSWLIRWEYRRDPPRVGYPYPLAHVHLNGTFPDGAPVGRLHVPTGSVGLELVIRHVITDWYVKPRSDDWETVLKDS
jgi:hypothetical protein